MSGFSAEWLALREPADHASRSADLSRLLADRFVGRSGCHVLDLGCGSGSTLRALAPLLPATQHWILVDHDEELLQAAREALCSWADAADDRGTQTLELRVDSRSVTVAFRRADLAGDLEEVLSRPLDLVTASALFDLVSSDWIERFATLVAKDQVAVHAALTYDGDDMFEPPHPLDHAVLEAFHRHQARDKGFGPAVGRHGAHLLCEALRRRRFEVMRAPSPWRLGPSERILVEKLLDGIAKAASDAGLAPEMVRIWRQERRLASRVTIGHTDVLAIPAA